MSGNPQAYTLGIDWFGVGGYPNNSDADYLLKYTITRGRDQTFTGDPASGEAKLARARVGQLMLTLDNASGRYDTYNASSPLYPRVTPGKIVQFSVTDDLSNSYPLFTGTIDDIRPAYGADKTVQIVCSDAWKPLSQNPMSTSMYLNGDVSKPMVELGGYLASVGALAGYAITPGSDVFPYIWGDEDTPYQVLHDLTELDGGVCHIDTLGFFRFISRINTVAQTPQFTLDQSQVLRDLLISQPWDNIINYVVTRIHDRTRNPNLVMVWTTPDVGVIQPGQSITRRIRYTGANGKLVPLASLAGSESQFNMPAQDRADGLGNIVNLPNLVRTIPPGGAVALQVTAINDKTYPVYLLFGSAAANNLCGGKLFSHPLDDLNPSDHAISDSVSIAFYGTRALRLDYLYMQGLNNASHVAAHYLARFKDPKATITVKLKNRSTIQFAYDLHDLLNFTSDYLTGQNTAISVKAPTTAISLNNDAAAGFQNADAELGEATGWELYNGPYMYDPVTPWFVTPSEKHAGSYSFGFVSAGGRFTYRLLAPSFSVTPGASHTYSVWYKITAQAGTGLLAIAADYYDVNGNLLVGGVWQIYNATTAGWVQFSTSTTAPANAYSIKIYVMANANAPGGSITCYVDDFVFDGLATLWNNPTSALAQDNNGAYANIWRQASPAQQQYTAYLKLTDFGFVLDPLQTIRGIAVRIRKKTRVAPPAAAGYTGGAIDYALKLVKGGTIGGSNKAKAETWTEDYADYVYGGKDDLWGLSLLYSDVNASNFGVAISAGCALCNANHGWAEAHVDYVEMTVYTTNGAFQSAYRIAGIKHETGISTKEVTTTWLLEPQVNSSGLLSPDQVISSPVAGEQFPIIGGITY